MTTVRLQRMGRVLRRLREQRGWTLETAAARMDRTASSLSKIERGVQALRMPELVFMLDEYGVTDERLRAQLLALARAGKSKGWWQAYRNVLSPELADYISLEADARTIRSFDGLRMPGLAQTEGYARATLVDAPPRVRDRFVNIRLKRQEILTRSDPPRLWMILAEAALRQQVGGADVMREQHRRLRQLAELDHVTVQVVPFSAGFHEGLDGSFIQMEVGSHLELTLVMVESLTRGWYLEDDEDIERYDTAFGRICDLALSEPDSLDLIRRLSSDL